MHGFPSCKPFSSACELELEGSRTSARDGIFTVVFTGIVVSLVEVVFTVVVSAAVAIFVDVSAALVVVTVSSVVVVINYIYFVRKCQFQLSMF